MNARDLKARPEFVAKQLQPLPLPVCYGCETDFAQHCLPECICPRCWHPIEFAKYNKRSKAIWSWDALEPVMREAHRLGIKWKWAQHPNLGYHVMSPCECREIYPDDFGTFSAEIYDYREVGPNRVHRDELLDEEDAACTLICNNNHEGE